MTFFKDFFYAIRNSLKGITFIFEKGIWPYVFYPLILWLIIWSLSVYMLTGLTDQIAEIINIKLKIKNIPDSGDWLPFAKPFLTGYFSTIISFILKIVFILILSTFSKYMTFIFLSPFFSILSESVEEKMEGTKYPFSATQLFKDIIRGIGISIRNMAFEYFFIILCFAVTLCFPPIIVITTPCLLFLSWYFTGVTILDYNFERHKMSIKGSVQFAKKYKGIVCGVGAVYSILMMLPFFIGMMVGPIVAIVGATICFLEINKNTKKAIS